MVHKIAIIGGAGSVGSTVAYSIILRRIATEIILVDIDEKRCEGEVLDLSDAAYLTAARVSKGNFQDAGKADIIIITAGAKQKPGETRTQLIDRNHAILKSSIEQMKPIQPKAVLLLVANPVDILTYFAQKLSGLPQSQVFGSGTFLDTNRLRARIADTLNVSETAVHAYVLGEHGDSQFVAWSAARVGGVPLTSFPELDQKALTEHGEFAKQKAYDIINRKGSTFYGIGAAVSSICESVLFDHKQVRPVSCYQEDSGICLSMPAVIGHKGVERILAVPLDENEKKALAASVKSLKDIIDQYQNK